MQNQCQNIKKGKVQGKSCEKTWIRFIANVATIFWWCNQEMQGDGDLGDEWNEKGNDGGKKKPRKNRKKKGDRNHQG